MQRGAWLAGLSCAFVPWFVLPRCAGAATTESQTTEAAPEAARGLSTELEFFRSGLGRFRSGSEAELQELRACAERCARDHARPDLKAVLEFYARLSASDRKQGFELEARFNEIYERARLAGADNSKIDSWPKLRETIFADLDQVVAIGRTSADFTPAARALSLRARLQRQRVVEDSEFDDAERKRWIQGGVHDAEESLTLFERAGLRTPTLEPAWALAWFDWARGDWAAAQSGFEALLGTAREVLRPDYQDQALSGLLRLAREAGDLPEIARLLDALSQVQGRSLSWDLIVRQASFLLSIDEPERAAEFLVRNKPNTEKAQRDWHTLLGSCLTRKGDFEGARAHERALEEMAAQDGLTRLSVIDARVRRADFEGAERMLAALAPKELSSAALRATRESLLGTVQLNLGRRSEAIASLERALAIGDSLQSLLGDADRQTASIGGEVIGLETVALLARARLEGGEPLRAAAAMEDRQARALRLSVSGADDVRIDEASVRAWAAAYESGLVTWIVGADTSVVVHVSRSGEARGAVLAVGRRAIEEAVRRLREAAIANDTKTVTEYAAEIQDVLVPVGLARAIGAAPGRLLLCAHGPLERLPFDLLPLFAGQDSRAIAPLVLPGLVENSPGIGLRPNAALEWSLVGDPIDEHGIERLPGVRAELAELKSLHGHALLWGAAAFDRSAMLEALASGRALHVASHLTSDLAKTSSIDTRLAHAAFELSSQGRFGIDDVRRARPRLPLAVLSACDSAGGEFVDGEAAIGIAKAFLESGTRNLLVTSWPVEDEAARAFTLAFHRALVAGALPSLAAVSARDTLRRSGAPIADWAAFRLLGRD